MDSSLQFISTANMSYDDWLAYRYTGIGASEVGCIMGLDQYKSPAELFCEKIGKGVRPTLENMAMFNGKHLEDYIANMWEHWESDEASVISNKNAGRKIRRMQKVNAYVRNPKYPWLFVSLDRKINKHGSKGEGALELKTIGGYEIKKWENGIKPSHLIQVQTQMGVCMFTYGELAVFIDGRKFDVFPFDFSSSIFEAIIESTHDFWERVKRGRSLVGKQYEARQNFDERSYHDLQLEIDSIEPPPTAGDAYLDFMAAKYKDDSKGLILEGTEEMLLLAQKHKAYSVKIDDLSDKKNAVEGKLKNYLKDAVELNFRSDGKITWRSNVKGTRVFKNSVK